jgi:hypothetical protein
MNKITPHLIRDLSATIPAGAECYLYGTVRRALRKYRSAHEPAIYLNKDQAQTLLTKSLGRGLKRFFINDMKTALETAEHSVSHKSLHSWPH